MKHVGGKQSRLSRGGKRAVLFMLLGGFFISILSVLLPFMQPDASAITANDIENSSNWKFQSRYSITGTIAGSEYTFVDKDPFDKDYQFEPQSDTFCEPRTSGTGANGVDSDAQYGVSFRGNYQDDNPASAFIKLGFRQGSGGNCVPAYAKKNIANDNNTAKSSYKWEANNIVSVANSKDEENYSLANGTEKFYVKRVGEGCAGGKAILLSDPESNRGKLYEFVSGGGFTLDYGQYPELKDIVESTCTVTDIHNITILGTKGQSIDEAGLGNDGENQDYADCQNGGDPLNWILCPIFDGMAFFADFLFQQIVEPLLRVSPISTDPSLCNNGEGNCTYQIWSSFRIIGNIFLIIAMLVIVFGQGIGGGLIDAYTAKKVLPRILVAAVLINLSIYIVAFANDIVNVIGGGIGSLMTTPLRDQGAFHITPSGVQQGTILGSAVGAAGFGVLLFKLEIFTKIAFLSKIVSFSAIMIFMPVILGLLAAFITLVMRQAIIVALVLVSPIAFALYCLPNTEQYFRKWWGFLLQTLLVYPIVVIFFAVADILSVTVFQSGQNNPVAAIISFVLQFLPLIFIPYAFRLAGGALGRIHEILTTTRKQAQEGIKGNPNDPNSLRNKVRRNAGAEFTRARAAKWRQYDKRDSNSRISRLGAYFTEDAIEKEALLTQAAGKRVSDTKDNGDDALINAAASFIDPTDGKRKSLDGGAEISETAYRGANRQLATLGEVQKSAEYRLGKVTSSEQGEQYAHNFITMAQERGMSITEANGMLKGITFSKQNEEGHLKHGYIDSNWHWQPLGSDASFERKDGANSKVDNFTDETYYKKNAYAAASQNAGYHHTQADAKRGYKQRLKDAGVDHTTKYEDMTDDQKRDYDKLKQNIESQTTWEAGGQYRDEATGELLQVGLSNASAATRAAFLANKQLDVIGKKTVTDKHGNTKEVDVIDPMVQRIKDEITAGQTYENEQLQNRKSAGGGP